MLLLVLATAASFMLVRASAATRHLVGRLIKIANDLRIELPRILIGPNGAMPMVWSFGKSRLFLPTDAVEWTDDRLNV